MFDDGRPSGKADSNAHSSSSPDATTAGVDGIVDSSSLEKSNIEDTVGWLIAGGTDLLVFCGREFGCGNKDDCTTLELEGTCGGPKTDKRLSCCFDGGIGEQTGLEM